MKLYKLELKEKEVDTAIQSLRLLRETIKEMSHLDDEVNDAMSTLYFKLTNAEEV